MFWLQNRGQSGSRYIYIYCCLSFTSLVRSVVLGTSTEFYQGLVGERPRFLCGPTGGAFALHGPRLLMASKLSILQMVHTTN